MKKKKKKKPASRKHAAETPAVATINTGCEKLAADVGKTDRVYDTTLSLKITAFLYINVSNISKRSLYFASEVVGLTWADEWGLWTIYCCDKQE